MSERCQHARLALEARPAIGIADERRGQDFDCDVTAQPCTAPGKTRPVLIVQAQPLLDAEHPSTLVVPLTTRVVDDAEPLRVRVKAAGRLRHDSDVLVDQLRAIDNDRLLQGPLLHLPAAAMKRVEGAIRAVLDLAD